MLEKELQPVATVNFADEYDTLALDELELENNISQQELFVFTALGDQLCDTLAFVIRLFQVK